MRKITTLVLVLGLPAAACADALVWSDAMKASTIAEYYVEEEGVRVELEIGLQDLSAFANLVPDELYEKLGNEPRPLAERLGEFFRRDFIVAAEGGKPLPGRVLSMGPGERVVRDRLSGEPVPLPEGEEPELVVLAELLYPFASRPESLGIGRPAGPAPVGIGFVLYHGGLPVNDFRYLGPSYVVDLDWEDPWYSSFRSRPLRRQYFAPMHGFLYVEPYEVRKEIILRPKDLGQWIDLGLEGREVLHAAEQPDLLLRIAEFLRPRQRVLIDGEEVPPELARINFLRRTLRNSTVIDPPEDLDLNSATLGAIFVYPTEGLPERVTMEWDLFSEKVPQVPVAAVDQAGPLPSILTPDYAVLEWQNFLKNPVLPTLRVNEPPPSAAARLALRLRWVLIGFFLAALAWMGHEIGKRRAFPWLPVATALLLLVGAAGAFMLAHEAVVTGERSRELVSGLLHNIYLAFDYRDEEKVYDVLARSAEGDLLTQIYLEMRRGLELQNQGGARVKVKEIELIDLETRPGGSGGFVARARWNVAGSVGHWGHVHKRTNQYVAELGIEPVEGAWKLTGLELLEEERL